MLFGGQTHAGVRLDALGGDGDHLAGQHVPHKGSAHRFQSAGLGGQNPGVVPPADAQGTEPEGVPGADELAGAHDHQRIGAPQFLHGAHHGFLHAAGLHPLAGDEIGDDLRVDGGLEDGACAGQFLAQLGGVDEVAVVGHGQSALEIIQYQGLGILPGAAAGGGISHMAHPQVALEVLESIGGEHLVHQAHALVKPGLTPGTGGVADGDAAALLAPVLQCKQAVVDGGGHVAAGGIIHAEYAALLAGFIRQGAAKGFAFAHRQIPYRPRRRKTSS